MKAHRPPMENLHRHASPGSLDDRALDQLFRTARTRKSWAPIPVPDALLEELYELLKFGPTSLNGSPVRLIFVKSGEAKAKLAPLLLGTNLQSVMEAPVCAIIGYDLDFPRHLGRLFPHAPDVAAHFKDPGVAREHAFRNGSLQGAYLMLAARALGLDVGPMSGFDAAGVTRAFFAGTRIEANFLCNLGYGTDDLLFPRQPRLGFAETAKII
jgi:3-hydroxypropanoate dehydrogenase